MRIPPILTRKSFERAGVAPEVFKVCAALFQVSTTRKTYHSGGLSGRAVGRSGAVYRRVAPTLVACVKLLPGASRGFPGTSLGL